MRSDSKWINKKVSEKKFVFKLRQVAVALSARREISFRFSSLSARARAVKELLLYGISIIIVFKHVDFYTLFGPGLGSSTFHKSHHEVYFSLRSSEIILH